MLGIRTGRSDPDTDTDTDGKPRRDYSPLPPKACRLTERRRRPTSARRQRERCCSRACVRR